MAVTYAYSTKKPYDAALSDIRRQLYGFDPRLLICFASPAFDLGNLSWGLKALYPHATSFGCSTAGEIASGRLLSGSIVVMALDSASIEDVAVVVVPHLSHEPRLREAFLSLGYQLGTPTESLDYEAYFGIALVDGLSMVEESLMDRIGDMTNVAFIGGSAGDDMRFAGTHVCAEGMASSDAAVLAIIKPKSKFELLKTQSFRVLNRQLTATKVDEARREVIMLNDRPAVQEYAAVTGCAVRDVATRFARNPVGIIDGNEPFVRSPQRVEGTRLRFFGSVSEGMRLHLLEATNIVADTRDTVEHARARGPVSAIVNFHSAQRTLELERTHQTDAYARIFAKNPTIGFGTYGEQYIGHVNQTSTMLVLR